MNMFIKRVLEILFFENSFNNLAVIVKFHGEDLIRW